MKVSGNEIEISFRKAALGAEIPLGLAEDFGRIGYWLSSDRWGRGATTAAFGLILGLEKRIGL